MWRFPSVRTQRRTTALVLVIAGTVLGVGVMRSTSGAVAATPPPPGTGTPHTAHTPGVSHARGAITSPGAGHTQSATHSAGATTTAGGATGTHGASHTPSVSHARGTTNSPGAAPGATANGTSGAAGPNARYVQHLYTDLVGSGDPNGEAYWASQLDAGSTRDTVAFPLTQTDGYRSTVVGALYQKVMHRPADAPGLAYWVGRLAGGMTPEQLAASLTGSDEWFANPQFGNGNVDSFIAAVYQSLLGRAADAPGAAYWHDFLMTGGPRWRLTLDFAYSQEWAGQTVGRLFTQYHLGTPDPQGLAYWQGRVESGMRDDQLAAMLVSSNQYFGWAQTH